MDLNLQSDAIVLEGGIKTVKHNSHIKKILLIQPPAFTDNKRHNMNPNPPLGIAYIAAVLESNNYNVSILDAFIEGWNTNERVNKEKLLVGLSFEDIQKHISDINPDVVGITSMFTSQRKNVHRIAEITKQISANIVVLVGGAHPTAATSSVLKDRSIDFVVLGEGENSIIPLLQSVENNYDFRKLNGIAYVDDVGDEFIIEKRDQIEDLDTIPFPARHLLPMKKYFDAGVRHGGESKGDRALSIITSRGCQYKCNFCTAFKVFTRKPRLRSAKNVIDEIRQLVTNYNIDEIWFEDDQLLAKRKRTIELLKTIKTEFNLKWDTPNGISPWLLDEETIKIMSESGCYMVNLAVESGVQDVLKNIINKPVNLSKIPETIALIKKYGMSYTTFLVVGNISREKIETIKQIKQSFKFMRKIRAIPHVSLLTAYPGSPVLDIAIEKGYLIPGFDWDDLIIQKSQLTTNEWTPELLIKTVRLEHFKTKLYVYMLDSAGRKHLMNVFKNVVYELFSRFSTKMKMMKWTPPSQRRNNPRNSTYGQLPS
jgi:anaerobic magnesium-protoporphyrin IX monomethyl ester cyclase